MIAVTYQYLSDVRSAPSSKRCSSAFILTPCLHTINALQQRVHNVVATKRGQWEKRQHPMAGVAAVAVAVAVAAASSESHAVAASTSSSGRQASPAGFSLRRADARPTPYMYIYMDSRDIYEYMLRVYMYIQ